MEGHYITAVPDEIPGREYLTGMPAWDGSFN